ncbi:MAG: nitroreductase [Deltaproteobacteria bacterium]|nr:nitroreductase [Deltaproteobacteria bacterium]
MNDVLEVIKERRSIRNFEDRDVDDKLVEKVLEALRWAPSWANTQCWEVVVIRDPEVRAAVGEAMPKANPASKAVKSAPVLLALCGRLNTSGFYKGLKATKFGDWFMFDLGIAAQNIMLAAHAVGLGTVVAGLFDQDAVARAVNLPDGYELLALFPMGFASKVPSAPKRKTLSEFIHYDRF